MIGSRRGFTLAELLIATVVMGILGVAMTRILVNDSRFVSKVEAMMNARQAARAALNTMAVELQMVSHDGLLSADRTSIELRVPYAFGILCNGRQSGSNWVRYAVLVPTDSLMYDAATPNGVGWRDATGDYAFFDVSNVSLAPSALQSYCIDAGIRVPDNRFAGKLIQMQFSADPFGSGDVFYLYQDVRYRFSTSVEVPGRLALWRLRTGSAWEELLSPFDPSSEFRFYVIGSDTARVAPPADLSQVTGLELRLVGASEVIPQGSLLPPSFELTTRVNFLNRR
jgi:prepilin-type N-terminal cleavage/methylation domain-containing protein